MQNIINSRIYKTLRIAHLAIYKITIACFFLLLILFSLYLYFVASAIVSAVNYKDTKMKIIALHSELSTLETEYLQEKQSLTKEMALSLGLAELSGKDYITRTVLVGRAD